MLAIIPRWDTIFWLLAINPKWSLLIGARSVGMFCFYTHVYHPPVTKLNCNVSACRIFGHIPLFCFYSFMTGLLQLPPLWIWYPQYFLIRLQKVQNNAAHLILKAPGKILSSWKTILHFIFKLCTGFQSMWESNTKLQPFASVITSTGPAYLSDLLKVYKMTNISPFPQHDTDLCVRVWQAGYICMTQCVCGACVFCHCKMLLITTKEGAL